MPPGRYPIVLGDAFLFLNNLFVQSCDVSGRVPLSATIRAQLCFTILNQQTQRLGLAFQCVDLFASRLLCLGYLRGEFGGVFLMFTARGFDCGFEIGNARMCRLNWSVTALRSLR